jgi:steroid delta-isomerase-like uncharacterized protein
MSSTTSAVQVADDASAAAANRSSAELIGRWVEIVNSGSLDALGEVWAPGCVVHAGGGIPDVHGLGALKQVLVLYRAALPDLTVTADDIVTEGDRVAARFTTRGTHTGEFLGIAGTGKPVVMGGFGIFRIVDGLLAEEWLLDDLVSFLTQIGAFPAPQSSGDIR